MYDQSRYPWKNTNRYDLCPDIHGKILTGMIFVLRSMEISSRYDLCPDLHREKISRYDLCPDTSRYDFCPHIHGKVPTGTVFFPDINGKIPTCMIFFLIFMEIAADWELRLVSL
jgi:hypothetical protein